MSPWTVAVTIAAVVLVGLYLSMTAGRLDRLHRRIDMARLSLDAHLLRRSSVAIELAASGVLDPASSVVIADAAHGARLATDADPLDRALAESDLSKALSAVLDSRGDVDDLRELDGGELLDELAAACSRVALSRRFLNDGVRACRQLRRQRLVRWFNLAGRTPWPETVELDDSLPAGFVR